MPNPVTFKAEQHGSILGMENIPFNWFCSQLPPSIIDEVHVQLVTTSKHHWTKPPFMEVMFLIQITKKCSSFASETLLYLFKLYRKVTI